MSRSARRALFAASILCAALGVSCLFAGVSFGGLAFVGALVTAFALVGVHRGEAGTSLWSTPRHRC